jgi:hypothetical protein
VTDVRHVLVLPDRDAAEELAEDLSSRFPLPQDPRPVRDALAGEDDAEDAQWLLVIEDPEGDLSPADLETITEMVEAHDGWVEED